MTLGAPGWVCQHKQRCLIEPKLFVDAPVLASCASAAPSSIHFHFSVLLQSKEVGLQLQEDLMKVLNELYTVNPADSLASPQAEGRNVGLLPPRLHSLLQTSINPIFSPLCPRVVSALFKCLAPPKIYLLLCRSNGLKKSQKWVQERARGGRIISK